MQNISDRESNPCPLHWKGRVSTTGPPVKSVCILSLPCLYIKTFLVAQRLKHLPAMQETWVQSLGREDPLEKEMATHSSILAWRIPWTEEPGGLHRVAKSQTRLSNFTHSLTHSNTGGCCLPRLMVAGLLSSDHLVRSKSSFVLLFARLCS